MEGTLTAVWEIIGDEGRAGRRADRDHFYHTAEDKPRTCIIGEALERGSRERGEPEGRRVIP